MAAWDLVGVDGRVETVDTGPDPEVARVRGRIRTSAPGLGGG